MKVFVVNGDNEVASRKRLAVLIAQAREKGIDIQKISLDASSSISDVALNRGLFGESVLLIDNAGRLKKKELEMLLSRREGNIILFQSGFISKTLISALPDTASLEEFKLPNLIYKFLDSFYPGNVKNALNLFHQIASSQPEELILHLLSRFLRDLYLLKIDGVFLGYPEWRMLKLESQSEKFTQKKLSRLINKLAEIDVSVKTSKESLVSSL